MMGKSQDLLLVLGRLLIAPLFIGGFAQKVSDPGPVTEMLSSIGLPSALVLPLALFNLGAGLALLLGWRLAVVCPILALYCMATSFFHWQLRADPWQLTIVVKNMSTAGGLLALGVAVAAVDPRRNGQHSS